ncbi:hypothetical protein AAY473_015286 [Plecturocebus cupreus]
MGLTASITDQGNGKKRGLLLYLLMTITPWIRLLFRNTILSGHNCQVRKALWNQDIAGALTSQTGRNGSEIFVELVEVFFMDMTTLIIKETSVVQVALVAAMVMLDTVTIGLAITEVVMMRVVLEVVEAIMILAITITNLQILDS